MGFQCSSFHCSVLVDRLSRQFTQVYDQPSEYHFCLEPVIAAEWIAQHQGPWPRELKIADVGAGCGVFGMELCHHLRRFSRCHSLELHGFEIQELFFPFFQRNRARAPNSKSIYWQPGDIRRTASHWRGAFDLIVANLPFFPRENSILSPSSVRSQCRFELNGLNSELEQTILTMLKPKGLAYVLTRGFLPPEGILSQIVIRIRRSFLVRYENTVIDP
ncbi:MAG: hypothetical protein C5B49_11000 [Bdellovibrio sp.]|nr:MAG: hypothetical protein C5B49_11000 [Bdellovibrio sp.]